MKKNHYIIMSVFLVIGAICAVVVYDKAFRGNEPTIDELRLYAHQGDLDAQNKLGAAYFHGKGIQKNAAEAERWFREAAEKGHARAQHNLAVMHYLGQGVSRNNEEAAKWFGRAAMQGLAEAQYNLGVMFYQGTGVNQDFPEAFRLYTESARKGYALAQYNLGMMYLEGKGTPKDQVNAYMWISLASGKNLPEAVKNRKFLEGKMPPDQLEKARKLAKEWRPV